MCDLDSALEDALECLLTLKAMYPLDGELVYTPQTAETVARRTKAPDGEFNTVVAHNLGCTITIVHEGPRPKITLPVEVAVSCHSLLVEVRLGRIDIGRGTWSELNKRFTEAEERLRVDLLTDDGGGVDNRAGFVSAVVSELQDIALDVIQSLETAPADTKTESTAAPERSTSFIRVWYRFPSLSTKSKRDDLVDFAPRYRLTGFVIAGKPGLLCLECPADAPSLVDDYMSEIKRVSWSDIPPAHKKVSEVVREEALDRRAFSAMSEVTEDIGKRGERANRVEGAQVAEWLRRCGIADDVVRRIMMSG